MSVKSLTTIVFRILAFKLLSHCLYSVLFFFYFQASSFLSQVSVSILGPKDTSIYWAPDTSNLLFLRQVNAISHRWWLKTMFWPRNEKQTESLPCCLKDVILEIRCLHGRHCILSWHILLVFHPSAPHCSSLARLTIHTDKT